MDVNLTGALAANVSLLQGFESEFSATEAQIISSIVTAIVTLSAVGLTYYLTTLSERRKRNLDEKEKWLKSRKYAYKNFLEIFSAPIDYNRYDKEFPIITKEHLEATLEAVEFGDKHVESIILLKLNSEENEIASLGDIIKFIIKLRCRTEINIVERIEVFHRFRIEATDKFSSSFLETLTSNDM